MASFAPAAYAEATPAAIDSLIKEIMRDEIKLAKFNLHYRQEVAKQGRWKGWRYFAFQESNAALTEASLIVAVAERVGHVRDRQFLHLDRTTLENGNVLGGIGQTLGACGSALEFAINGFHSLRAAHHGFAPGTANVFVKKLTDSIDGRLTQVGILAQAEGGRLAKAHALEIEVLDDIRDLLVNEYDGFHIRARRTIWQQQSFYVLDIAKNVTGAVGNIYGFRALHEHNRNFNKPAGVLCLVSGAFIMAAPILSRVAGLTAGKVDSYCLKRSGLATTQTRLSHLQEDMRNLKTLIATPADAGEPELPAVDRFVHYEGHTQRFVQQLEIGLKEQQAGTRIAIQNVFSGLFVGGTKLTNGIMFTDAGYNYNRDGRMTNALLGIGAIPYLAGTAYSLADNLRIQVKREIDNHRLGKKNSLPGQLIKQQLKQLDALESSLDAS